MKNTVFSIIFILLIASCAAVNVNSNMIRMGKNNWVEKDLIKYVKKFKKLSNGKVKEINVNIMFSSLGYSDKFSEKETIGICNLVTKTVYIDKKWWKETKNELAKEELIFHELGHCILDRDHTSAKIDKGTVTFYNQRSIFTTGIIEKYERFKDGCPKSMMHPYSFSKTCLKIHRKHYIKELFSNCRPTISLISEDLLEITSMKDFVDCPKTVVENKSKEKWKKIDDKNKKYAKRRCPRVTGQPCLKIFRKVEPLVYHAVCGSR